ncbi:Hypothetical protein CINCED_3A013962 [Cinara cedri]|uniref:Cytochrome b561 domain-containing protein n=1 Tax=Cinara cedri TaxID=506608 RepID=A0A5E4MF77_9HEMI|nr:Hypothetical protein CINCED_3A013962 [Cinara cedri]
MIHCYTKVTLELAVDKYLDTFTMDGNNLNNHKENGNKVSAVSYVRISTSFYTLFQITGILIVLSVFFWLHNFRNGFGFSEIGKVCNWHPLLMTIAFIYLFANSILHFRYFHNDDKLLLKIQHAIIHCIIIIVAAFGIWAGLSSNKIAKPPVPKFYSLHSWLGIITIILFVSQFSSGFVSFLYPEINVQYKKALMPYHKSFGILTFVLSVVTTVLGFSEKIISALYASKI